MLCATGRKHTVTISDDNIVYSFGYNSCGQLGLGHNEEKILVPTPIPNLRGIKQISCGFDFTVCVDHEGFMWSFGFNICGQLGTGDTIKYNIPQKIQDIPPVQSVCCGGAHTFIITMDKNLWGCGYNEQGQLCIGNHENQKKLQKTSLSNIIQVSAGDFHSLFQNSKGEIYGCGNNKNGELGQGLNNDSNTEACHIPNLPPNIIQFCCGSYHSLFLDIEGNVFSVGFNEVGCLGLGHYTNQNELQKIENIPSIKVISCVGSSSYLLDFGGNIWSFGNNEYGQLGHDHFTHLNIPTKISSINNIEQISHGSLGHFLAKNNQNQIFVIGNNEYGQLGKGNTISNAIPKEIIESANIIWGKSKEIDKFKLSNMYFKTKIENWKEDELKKLDLLQEKILQVKRDNNSKEKQEFPKNSFENWNEVQCFLNDKFNQIDSIFNQQKEHQMNIKKNINSLESELIDIEKTIQQLQERKKDITDYILPDEKKSYFLMEENIQNIEYPLQIMKIMCSDVSVFCKNENEMNNEIEELFKQKKFIEFSCFDLSKVLWKMDLIKYQQNFEDNQITGEFAAMMIDDWTVWKQLGLDKRDCFYVMFYFKMMNTPGYCQVFSPNYDFDCCVCSHNTPEKTIHLLREYDIPIEDDLILTNNFCTPILTFPIFKDILVSDVLSPDGRQIMSEINEWKKIHKLHLKSLKTNK